MNEGAACFHSDIQMDFTTANTIRGVISDIKNKFHKCLSVFYGVSVSIRYAVRGAMDLVEVADTVALSMYNRFSVTFNDDTFISVYRTGKAFILSHCTNL